MNGNESIQSDNYNLMNVDESMNIDNANVGNEIIGPWKMTKIDDYLKRPKLSIKVVDGLGKTGEKRRVGDLPTLGHFKTQAKHLQLSGRDLRVPFIAGPKYESFQKKKPHVIEEGLPISSKVTRIHGVVTEVANLKEYARTNNKELKQKSEKNLFFTPNHHGKRSPTSSHTQKHNSFMLKNANELFKKSPIFPKTLQCNNPIKANKRDVTSASFKGVLFTEFEPILAPNPTNPPLQNPPPSLPSPKTFNLQPPTKPSQPPFFLNTTEKLKASVSYLKHSGFDSYHFTQSSQHLGQPRITMRQSIRPRGTRQPYRSVAAASITAKACLAVERKANCLLAKKGRIEAQKKINCVDVDRYF